MVLFLGSVTSAWATDYFISPYGDDSHNGTSAEQPWKTLDRLQTILNTLRPGDRVMLEREGTYKGSISIAGLQGSAGQPITFTAYGTGSEPIVTGAVGLNNWTLHEGRIWKTECASCPATLQGVYMNAEAMPLGRYPNADEAHKGYLSIDQSHDFEDNKIVVDKELSGRFPDDYWKGAEIVVRTRRWLLDRATIASHAGGVISLSDKLTYGVQQNFGYFIQDSYKTLDRDREWYFDPESKTIYIYLEHQNPNEQKLQAAGLPTLLHIASSSYLLIKDLSFETSSRETVRIMASNHITLENNAIGYSAVNGVYAENCDYLQFLYNTIDNTGNNALEVKGNNGRILHNKIHNTAMIAGMGSSGNGQYNAVDIRGNDLLFQYNEVVNAGYLGVQFKGNQCTIQQNYISHVCMVKDDGSGIYTFNNQGTDNRVIDNIVLYAIGVPEGTDEPHAYPARGLYTDGGTSGVLFKGNTVAHCGEGILLHVSRDITVENNILYANRDHALNVVYTSRTNRPDTRNLNITNNILYNEDDNRMIYHLMSFKNDVREFGYIDGNYIVNPLQDATPQAPYAMHLAENTLYPQGEYIERTYYSHRGMKLTPYGHHDHVSPVSYQKYQIKDTLSANLLRNSSFSEKISSKDWIKFPNNSSNFSIANDAADASLKASFSALAPDRKVSVLQREFHLDKNAYYLLTFEVKGSQKSMLPFTANTWGSNVVHATKYFDVDTVRKSYQYIFQAKATTDKGRVVFDLLAENGTLWFDNITLHKVTVEQMQAENLVRLEYNNTQQDREIALDGYYLTPDGQRVSGKISLPPYQSVVLIRDLLYTAPAPAPETSAPAPVVVAKGELPWLEQFDLPGNTRKDTGATAWSFEAGNLQYLYGVEQQMLKISKAGEPVVWRSQSIDIAAASWISLSADIKETGVLESQNSARDFLHFSYRVDSGAWQTLKLQEGNLPLDNYWYTFQTDSIQGALLELQIEGKTTAGDESYFVDNISVRAYIDTLQETPASSEPADTVAYENTETGTGNEPEHQEEVVQPHPEPPSNNESGGNQGEPAEPDTVVVQHPDGQETQPDTVVVQQPDEEDKEEAPAGEGQGNSDKNNKGSVIRIFAAGRSGKEAMELWIDDQAVKSWPNIAGSTHQRTFIQYVYTHTRTVSDPSSIKIVYPFDEGDSTELSVDKILVDGVVFETEASSTYSGSDCEAGYRQDERLPCAGYFHYAYGDAHVTAVEPAAGEVETVSMLAYPNPAAQSVHVRISGPIEQGTTLSLMNIMGHRLYHTTEVFPDRPIRIDLSALRSGVYVLHVESRSRKSNTLRIVKR